MVRQAFDMNFNNFPITLKFRIDKKEGKIDQCKSRNDLFVEYDATVHIW